MKIDKYYVIGFAVWFLYILFVSLAIKQLINIVALDQVLSGIFGFIGWIIVMIWIRGKQRKNWRNI